MSILRLKGELQEKAEKGKILTKDDLQKSMAQNSVKMMRPGSDEEEEEVEGADLLMRNLDSLFEGQPGAAVSPIHSNIEDESKSDDGLTWLNDAANGEVDEQREKHRLDEPEPEEPEPEHEEPEPEEPQNEGADDKMLKWLRENDLENHWDAFREDEWDMETIEDLDEHDNDSNDALKKILKDEDSIQKFWEAQSAFKNPKKQDEKKHEEQGQDHLSSSSSDDEDAGSNSSPHVDVIEDTPLQPFPTPIFDPKAQSDDLNVQSDGPNGSGADKNDKSDDGPNVQSDVPNAHDKEDILDTSDSSTTCDAPQKDKHFNDVETPFDEDKTNVIEGDSGEGETPSQNKDDDNDGDDSDDNSEEEDSNGDDEVEDEVKEDENVLKHDAPAGWVNENEEHENVGDELKQNKDVRPIRKRPPPPQQEDVPHWRPPPPQPEDGHQPKPPGSQSKRIIYAVSLAIGLIAVLIGFMTIIKPQSCDNLGIPFSDSDYVCKNVPPGENCTFSCNKGHHMWNKKKMMLIRSYTVDCKEDREWNIVSSDDVYCYQDIILPEIDFSRKIPFGESFSDEFPSEITTRNAGHLIPIRYSIHAPKKNIKTDGDDGKIKFPEGITFDAQKKRFEMIEDESIVREGTFEYRLIGSADSQGIGHLSFEVEGALSYSNVGPPRVLRVTKKYFMIKKSPMAIVEVEFTSETENSNFCITSTPQNANKCADDFKVKTIKNADGKERRKYLASVEFDITDLNRESRHKYKYIVCVEDFYGSKGCADPKAVVHPFR